MTIKTIEEKFTELNRARDALDAALQAAWPPGTEIEFKIMYGQKVASTGTVGGSAHDAGYVRVDHHQAKRNGRYRFRSVHYTDIFTEPQQ